MQFDQSTYPGEMWTGIPGYHSRYLAGEYGRVLSLVRRTEGGQVLYRDKAKFMAPILSGGYLNIMLSNEQGKRIWRVNRLIATVFIPNPDNLPEVNHLDGNPFNNHVGNLEWCTRSQNMKHLYSVLQRGHVCGEASAKSPLKNGDVMNIYLSSSSQQSLADTYGVSRKCIRDIRNGISWKHITSQLNSGRR
jgi:hypothetical protein